jgi:Ferredoxin
LDSIADYFLIFYLGLLGFVLLARGARAFNERRGAMISLSYGNGRTIRVPKGLSVLEASLRYNIPHASVCGGRARCSTCRIRVIGDCTSLPAVQAGGLCAEPGGSGRSIHPLGMPVAADG